MKFIKHKNLMKIFSFYPIAVMILILYISIAFSEVPEEVSKGMDLFEGKVPFANGGPPCISCHSISALDIKGGTVGPDLSRVFISGKFTNFASDEEKLKSFLSKPTTPTMSGIWSATPLTNDEINALAKLLIYASKQAPPTVTVEKVSLAYEWIFLSSGAVGLLVAFIAYLVVLRRG